VKALLQAELLKVQSTRTTVGLLLATLAFVALTTVVSIPQAGDVTAPISFARASWPALSDPASASRKS